MVTWAFLTPSVLSLLQPQDIPSLRTVLVGGEKVPQKLVADWAENVSLHIMMGPSECSIFCASTEPVRSNQDPSNFGRAAGCRGWVVEPSDYSKLAPLDCVGELILEGRIVGREYLNDPQRTLASFVHEMPWLPVPYEKSTTRLYKSGDIVRMNSRDGTLSFVGRKDQQFKLHGQRIEVGEIEHNIKKALSNVTRVLALMRSTEQSYSRHSLVAFLIIERGSPMVDNTHTAVQGFTEYGYSRLRAMQRAVAEALPSYMIPTLFVPLYEVPLNASGKTDVIQLRRLIDTLSQKQLLAFALSQTTTTATLTSAEANLRSLWAKILHMDKSLIGPDSEFLRLGGDSLTAMTLVLEAAKIGIHLTVPDVLKASRLSTMASSIRNFPEQIEETEIDPYTLLPTGTKSASLKAHCASTCGVNPSQIEDIFPSTPVQEMLFASSLKHPGSYITRLSCRLPSTVSLSAWKSAWDEVLKTVDIFRARIVFNSNSDLLQVVISGAIDWKFHDNLEDYWARDTQITMNSGDPLARFGIIQDDPSEQAIFALTCHHMIYDAFTLNMVFEQVTNACKNQPVESLVSFKNYVSYIKSLPLGPSCEFWRHKLEGSSTASWPPNQALETHPAFAQGYASIPTPQNADFTIAMYAQTAYALLISAYSGSQDTIFGLVDSGRRALLRSIMNIAGPTLQTVPFRSIIGPNEKLGQLISRFRSDTFEMADHGHIGLQQIRQISPDAAQGCDFRTLLVIQPQELARHSNWFDTDLSLTESVATYALTFECHLVEGGINIVAEYDSRTLSKVEVDRFIQQFAHLVSKLATSSLDLPVNDISCVSDEDLEQIQRWNSRKDVEVQDSIHEVIGLRMAEYASLQAVCGWDGILTYGELDLISARLAARLRALGVTSETIVPICSEKSSWVPVAVVAILRAGGAFLLLDPSNPEERLRDMVSQVEAKQIIVSPDLVDSWTPFFPDLIALSPAIGQWEEQWGQDSWSKFSPHNLAYVVFTSGSTGKPKGVLVEHTNFLTSALARAPGIYRTHASRVYQFSSYSFDTSVEDMLTTLIVGGTICIPNEQEQKSNLLASMNKYATNTADLTPSVANLITPSMVPLLKVLILGGEAMTESHIERWASSDCKLINTYGPAECSIVGTVAEPAQGGCSANDIVIGKAPCGHAWVVDPLDHRKLAPIGAIGELLIEGPLVARGYLNDPLKTDEMFVKNLPWAPSPARFYKTGDLVKYQDNGNLTFVGRRDSQVKIYGQRLELREIERRLLAAKHILSAAVELFKFSNNRQRLVAFVCFEQDEKSTCKNLEMSPQLRGQLAVVEAGLIKALPRYMVPTVFIPLNIMPLAVTGKLDRRLMRQMVNNMSRDTLLQYSLSESARDGKVPNTEAQHRLQKIWSKVLDIPQDKIGLNSNFFGIGGDSISAMQLSMSVSQQYGSNLSVADILRNPILADMADLLKVSSNTTAGPSLSDPGPYTLLKAELSVADVLQQSGLQWSEDEIEDLYPCTPLQEGFMALGASQPEAYVARQVFRIPDHLDIERFRNCWTQIMTTHAILRTRIVYLENHGSLQVVGKSIGDWAFANSLQNYISQDRSIGMSYNDSLCRFCIVQEETPKLRYLVHTIHHALFDGVSLQTLDRQVSLLYHSDITQIPRVPFTRFIS
jgi:amino acid adenylation domain-containing protein